MSAHDLAALISAITAAVSSIAAAIVSVVNAIRGSRIERKVDSHEALSAERSFLLARQLPPPAEGVARLVEASPVLQVGSPLSDLGQDDSPRKRKERLPSDVPMSVKQAARLDSRREEATADKSR